ncbi:MAG: hypothetical protein Q9204_006570, partial [Flavoplaca sp. TL-2023a]
ILDLFDIGDTSSSSLANASNDDGKGKEEDTLDVTGELKEKGKKGYLDDLGELWDGRQYEEEYDLDSFLRSMKRAGVLEGMKREVEGSGRKRRQEKGKEEGSTEEISKQTYLWCLIILNDASSCKLFLIGSVASNIQAPSPQQVDPDNEDDGMDADQAAQRAALAKQRRSHKRTARRKKSLLNQEDHPTLMMAQARRWVNNEQRKEDNGGVTWQGFKELFAWTKAAAKASPGTSLTTRMSADAEQAKERFYAELENARKDQDRRHGVRDWWVRAPSFFERTGIKRNKERDILVAENAGVFEDQLDKETAHDAEFEGATGFGVEMRPGEEQGATDESIVGGVGLMDVEEHRGRMEGGMTLEPVLRSASGVIEDDAEMEGGVKCLVLRPKS